MKRNRAQEFGPSPYRPLIIKYSILALYGLGSSIVGITTIDVVAGPSWGLIWPAMIAFLSLAALTGVVRSWVHGKEGFELVATLLLIAVFAGYVVAIIARTLGDGSFERLPVALLPIAFSVYPSARLVQIARTSKT